MCAVSRQHRRMSGSRKRSSTTRRVPPSGFALDTERPFLSCSDTVTDCRTPCALRRSKMIAASPCITLPLLWYTESQRRREGRQSRPSISLVGVALLPHLAPALFQPKPCPLLSTLSGQHASV